MAKEKVSEAKEKVGVIKKVVWPWPDSGYAYDAWNLGHCLAFASS